MESNYLQQHYAGFQHVENEELVVSDRKQGMANPMSHHLGDLIHHKMVLVRRCIYLVHSPKLG